MAAASSKAAKVRMTPINRGSFWRVLRPYHNSRITIATSSIVREKESIIMVCSLLTGVNQIEKQAARVKLQPVFIQFDVLLQEDAHVSLLGVT